MARQYYGIDRGETRVTQGSSTTSKDIEATIDLAIGLSRADFFIKLDELKNAVIHGNWPPASSEDGMARFGMNRGQTETGARSDLPDHATGTVTAASVEEADEVDDIDGVTLTAQDLTNETSVLCVADDTSDLQDTYFKFYVLVDGEIVAYAVRISVDAGGTYAPVAGCITLHANIAEDDLAATVATAVHAVIDASVVGATATLDTATITIVNDAIGAVTAAADEDTGFTIATERAGADAPDAGNFSMNGTDAEVAASIADAINASAAAVSAVAADDVVTITADVGGTAGNAITFTSSDGTRLAVTGSGTLEGGAAATLSNDDVYIDIDTTAALTDVDFETAIQRIQDVVATQAWPPA